MTVSTFVRSGGIVTVTTSTAHPFKVGDTVVVTGGPSGFAGTFVITAVNSATSVTYVQAGPNANLGGSPATIRHQASDNKYRVETKPIGFGLTPGDPEIEAIAHAGGAPDLPGVNERYSFRS